jgi:hypothetical protein
MAGCRLDGRFSAGMLCTFDISHSEHPGRRFSTPAS